VSAKVLRPVLAFKSYWPEPGEAAPLRPAPLAAGAPAPVTPGEQASSARLTWAQVRHIRARHAAGGISLGQLARECGVNVSTVSRLVRHPSWWPDPADEAAR
jgi:hypothetical protein